MSTIQIKSNLTIEDLIGNLCELDTPTLNYLVASLRKVQLEREHQSDDIAMNAHEFWNLLKKIDWKQNDDTARLQPVINALAALPVAEIYRFSNWLAFLLHQLDGPAFAQPLEQDELGFSSDTFLYARCLVVGKGEKFYKTVLSQPPKMPVGEDFEALLHMAEQAYQRKTGKVYNYVPSINYESFFNRELWGERAASV